MSKPYILVSNDDGISSNGIKALVQVASEFGDVVVVAPDRQQSAVAHAITLESPLRAQKMEMNGQCEGFAINGTPADSVKFAMNVIMKKKPDILVSGINLGSNIGQSILYSGTVSAAREGSFRGCLLYTSDAADEL